MSLQLVASWTVDSEDGARKELSPGYFEPLKTFVLKEVELLWGIIGTARLELQGLLFALQVRAAARCTLFAGCFFARAA